MRAYYNAETREVLFTGTGIVEHTEPFIELTEEQYQSIIHATNKKITVAEDNALIFIEKEVVIPPEILKLQKIEDLNRQQETLAKQKEQMVLTTLEMHEQALMEIIQSVDLKGGETMVINIIVARIVNGFMEYRNVPAPIKPQVKQGLIDLGLEFLVVE